MIKNKKKRLKEKKEKGIVMIRSAVNGSEKTAVAVQGLTITSTDA